MQTVRSRQTETVAVTDCPHCGSAHRFDLQAVIDEVIGVMHMVTTRTEIKTCAVTCPDKGQTLMVDVPVLLTSGQTLVSVK
jgi:RNase P subunit RPR2